MPVSKPAKLPRWATSAGRTVEPPETGTTTTSKDYGYILGTRPPARMMNWWKNLVYQWCQYLDDLNEQDFTSSGYGPWTEEHDYTGGDSGRAPITITAAASSAAPGISSTGEGVGAGGVFIGGANGPGVYATGKGGLAGTISNGDGAGAGILGTGGSGGGPGAQFQGGSAGGYGISSTGGPTSSGGLFVGTDAQGIIVLVNNAGTSGNYPGVDSTGAGTSPGVKGTGGSGGGAGVQGVAGASGALGGVFTGNATGSGIQATGGSTGMGVDGRGGTGGNTLGVQGTGHGTAGGVLGQGGSTSGPGVQGLGGASNGDGVQGTGAGTGAGVRATGGSTGPGLVATGGGGNSSGVTATGSGTGVGISGTGGASGGIGVLGTAGNATSPGVKGIGSGSGTAGPAILAHASNSNNDAAVVVDQGTIRFTGSNPSISANLGTNVITGPTIAKSWGCLLIHTDATTPTIAFQGDGHNYDTASIEADHTTVAVTFLTPMANGNYDVEIKVRFPGGASHYKIAIPVEDGTQAIDANGFAFRVWDLTAGAILDLKTAIAGFSDFVVTWHVFARQ